jgi:hypothetical protein
VRRSKPGAAPSQIADEVSAAVLAYAPFAAKLGPADSKPTPQGAMVLGLASVAAQASTYYLGQGVNTPEQLGQSVGVAIMVNYHFPLTQAACEVAAQSYFASFQSEGQR